MNKYLFIVLLVWLVLGLPFSADSGLADEPAPCVEFAWEDFSADEMGRQELIEGADEDCFALLMAGDDYGFIILSVPAVGSSWKNSEYDLAFASFHVYCGEAIQVGFDWAASPIGNDFNEGTPVSYVFDDAFTLSADHRESLSAPAFMEALRVLLSASDTLRVLTTTYDGEATEAVFDIRALRTSLTIYPECSPPIP